MAKILIYDIESSDLKADFGSTLAFGYKFLGDAKSTVLSLLDYYPACEECGRARTDTDKLLLRDAWRILASADMWVTYYGKGFDAPFLNSRMLAVGLPPLPPVPHVDLYWTARTNLRISSNRLASVQEFLQLPTEKTPLLKATWRSAAAGVPKALRYVAEHCYADVEVLQQAYEVLRPFVRLHPRVNGLGPCRVCGADNFQRRGKRFLTTLQKEKQIVWCKTCRTWDTRDLDDPAFQSPAQAYEESKEVA